VMARPIPDAPPVTTLSLFRSIICIPIGLNYTIVYIMPVKL